MPCMNKELPTSILSELQNSKGYDAAFFTSYSFDIAFFENKIKSILLINKIKKINLYVDYEKFVEAINDAGNISFGKQYYNYLINIKGAFHPKLILLLGKDKAKLIISSANIKKSSYFNNIEVFNVFEYNRENTEYASIINAAIKLFLQFENLSFEPLREVLKKEKFIDNDLHDYLSNYKIKDINNDKKTYLISNIEKPVIQQIEELIDEDISKIIISTPFFDNNLESIKEIKKHFSCNNVELYIQNKNNSFPIDFNAKYGVVDKTNINIFNELKKETGYDKVSDGFYHAKVIGFVGKTKGYILYGSANCSKNALLRTFKNNGNVECDILTETEKNKINEYFNNFKLEKLVNLVSEIKNETRNNDDKIKFLFGIKDSKTNLYFQLKDEEVMSITYIDKKCEYSFVNGILFVEINNDWIVENGETQEIVIETKDGASKIFFWFVDKKELSRFRENNDRYELENLNSLDEENYENILRTIYEMLKDENIFKYDPAIAKKESEYLKNDENFENEELEYEEKEVEFGYEEKQRNFSIINSIIGEISNNYYERFPIRKESSKSKNQTSETTKSDNKNESENEKRTIPNIRKIGNYLKRLCRKTLKESDSFTISDKTFVNLSGFILSSIYRYHYGKPDKEFLSTNEVLEIKFIIIRRLLQRARINREHYIKEVLINNVIRYIVEIGYLLHCNKIEYDQKELKKIVTELNELFNIQDELENMIRFTYFPEIASSIGYNAVMFAESLFPSKSKNKLLQELKDYFEATEIDIRVDKNRFLIFLNCKTNIIKYIKEDYIEMIIDYLFAEKISVHIIEITLLCKKTVMATYVIKINPRNWHIDAVEITERNKNITRIL